MGTDRRRAGSGEGRLYPALYGVDMIVEFILLGLAVAVEVYKGRGTCVLGEEEARFC